MSNRGLDGPHEGNSGQELKVVVNHTVLKENGILKLEADLRK